MEHPEMFDNGVEHSYLCPVPYTHLPNKSLMSSTFRVHALWIAVTATFLLCTSCSESRHPSNDSNGDNIPDTIPVNKIRSDWEPYVAAISHDTLTIASGAGFLYHPFDTIGNISHFAQQQGAALRVINASDGTALFRVEKNSSGVTFFREQEPENYEIVEGVIDGEEFPLKHGIHWGMQIGEFLKQLFTDQSDLALSAVHVVELESALAGIWHYYTFQDSVLIKVEFKTDYDFSP